MQPLHVYTVVPKLPEKLLPLRRLAGNLYFSWQHEIEEFFAQIDRDLWEQSEHNPVWFLTHLPQGTLEELAEDEFFLDRLSTIAAGFEKYVSKRGPMTGLDSAEEGPVVAYFSAEYGLAQCLPVYSGGLGVLAGDHLKSASDLNIPLVGIGLCYQRGYFRQYLTHDGWQQERYHANDFEQMPLFPVLDNDGHPLKVRIFMQGKPLFFRIWRVDVGRVPLFLMDTNIAENSPERRDLTSQLYGGDLEMRLMQEYLLGIGGIKALGAMGLSPRVIHMNEGHSDFAGLERIRALMADQGLSFEAALEVVAQSSVFTTHTPVPAGNDRFPPDLMAGYFQEYATDLGLSWKVFLALGREDTRNDAEHFCMTVLALRLSRFNNGVSRLPGKVSRRMWSKGGPQDPEEAVAVGFGRQGRHFPTWVAPEMSMLFDRFLGQSWREDPDCERVGEKFATIPDIELWRTHERLRERLVDFVRRRLQQQIMARGGRSWDLEVADNVFNPEVLTIGFARRFASYKRAYLLLKDDDRLRRLVTDTARPVQFIFAGKAHPRDNEGKKIIQELVSLCQSPETRGSMVFLEDYDMQVARYLVQGCDVWLNNPRRPLEACGTSGMKAMANGGLNLSTLDGWWDEAWQPDNGVGWAIGNAEEYDDVEYQDFVESQTLYNILEKDVIPLFYDRVQGSFPRRWVQKMKQALKSLGPVFNGHRMVEEYTKRAYLPSSISYGKLSADAYRPARDLAEWRMNLLTHWGGLDIRNVQCNTAQEMFVGESLGVSAEVRVEGLGIEDIRVEIYTGPLDHTGVFASRSTFPMNPVERTVDGWYVYRGKAMPMTTGKFGFTVRILPNHPLLRDAHSLGLIFWADEHAPQRQD
jgi:starch phosphorylase